MATGERAPVLVIHGPNLNMLGAREPEVYGRMTLAEIDRAIAARAKALDLTVVAFQSNSEGAIIDRIQASAGKASGLIVNPGGLTHTSVALRDAIAGAGLPTVEVHISNIFAREPFRHTSYISGVAIGVITGLGALGYELALEALARR